MPSSPPHGKPEVRRWRTFGLVATVLAVFAVGACGGGGQVDAAPNGLSVAELEPDHLTPGRIGGGLALDEMWALFAPLVTLDKDKQLVYVQAESIKSQDNKVWTIKIKPGWTFHNGEPVTTQSYVDGWNAVAYGPNAWANNFVFAKVAGYADLNPPQGTPVTDKLAGAVVVDDTTVRLTLTEPDSQLPYQITAGFGWLPMPKAAFRDLRAYDEAPIGNGPFMMDGTWQHNVEVKVKRFADYKGPQAKVDAITFKVYGKTETAYTDVLAGNVDILGGPTPIPTSKLSQIQKDFGDRSASNQTPFLAWLGFPSWDERFSDIRIRHAMSMAIDRQAINDKIFGGLYQLATGLIAPATVGGGTTSCGEYCTFDPVKAKALLAEAGGWSGPLRITYAGGQGDDAYFEAIANQLRQNLGIADVSTEALPGRLELFGALDSQSVTGPFGARWGSVYPSPQDLLTGVFQKGGVGNPQSGKYGDADVDRLIAAANSAGTPEAAADLFHQADARVANDFPVAPMFFTTLSYVHGERVPNVPVDPVTGLIHLTEVAVTG